MNSGLSKNESFLVSHFLFMSEVIHFEICFCGIEIDCIKKIGGL